MGADRVFVIVFVLVLAAEADETRQTVTFLMACLVGIAIALTLLTVWYWFYTDPRRQRGGASARSPLIDVEVSPAESATSEPVEATQAATEGVSGERPTASPGLPVTGPATSAEGGAQDAGVAKDGGTAEDFVLGPVLARQTWDFVAAAKRAESDGLVVGRSARPAVPRIAVPDRSSGAPSAKEEADELAVVRRRREREAARGLSDEVWNSVRQSVFDKLDDET